MSGLLTTTLRRGRKRTVRPIALLAPALVCILATCTMGDAPLSPRGAASSSRLTIRPQLTVLGGSFHSAPITRIHMVARTTPAQTIVADTTVNVGANDPTWSIGMDLSLPDGVQDANIIVTIELISITSGQPTVEWSGVSAPIAVTAGGVSQAPPPVPVFPGPPANLTITSLEAAPDSIVLQEGDSTGFTATATGATGTPLIIWSTLEPSIAAVSVNGVVRGIRNGSARVVAQAGPKADTVRVRFTQRAASLNVLPDSVGLTSVGEEIAVAARVFDPRGDSIPAHPINYVVRATGVAQLAGQARVRAQSNGRTYLVATSAVNAVLRDSVLVIVSQVAARVVVSPSAATTNALGATTQFALSVQDALGNEMTTARTWSTDNAAVATVDANGLARAVGAGVARITAAVPGAAPASGTLTVTQQPASVLVGPGVVTITAVNDTARLSAVVRDANGNVMTPGVTWTSSNTSVATVDVTGKVRAVASGFADITATAGPASGSARVNVTQRVAALMVSPHAATLASLGQTTRPAATANDANGITVPAPAITWLSRSNAVATVATDGTITAVANGTVIVVAEADGARDSIQVTVRQTATRITIDRSTDSVAVSDTMRLRANAFDALNNPVSAAVVTWLTSAATIASVNATGLVTGVAMGNADITAQVDAATAVSVIRVYRAPPAAIEILPDSLVFDAIGATRGLAITIIDRFGRVTPGDVTWSSLEPTIATVNGSGQVTSQAEGRARIVARTGNVADTVVVSVQQIPASLILTPDSSTITVAGGQLALSAVVRDANGHAAAAAPVTFTSLTPAVVTVSAIGVVTAVSNGSGRVKAVSGGAADTATVRVTFGAANLVMRPFLITPSDTLSDGTAASITMTVRNAGNAPTTAAMLRLRLTTASGAQLHADSAVIPVLLPGDSTILTRVLALDTVTQYPDSMLAAVEADANHVVAESNEGDNTYGRFVRILMSVARVQVRTPSGSPIDSTAFDALGDTTQLAAGAYDRFNRELSGR
ncbi:MAG: Ig-like domain-containing protein, partial [Longimicrobiales bacterium]